MGDELFSGLGKLGLSDLSDLELYESEEKKVNTAESAIKEKTITEADFLFDKSFKCPVCDKEFKSKSVKAGKAKMLGIDTDLRPRYQGIDSIKYDCITCEKCGYSALGRYFNFISAAQAKLIKEKISANFKGLPNEGDIYTYDDAILRHQLTLANAVVKKAKVSERGYICLKLAWLMRGKAENLPKDTADRDKVIVSLKEIEKDFIKKAYDGLKEAMYSEGFPIAGMDEWTFTYLVADLARQCGDNNNSMKLISDIIVSRAASERLKDKARELRKMMTGK